MSPFFPEISLDDERKEHITIRDMLEMRAGYPWEGRTPSYLETLFSQKIGTGLNIQTISH